MSADNKKDLEGWILSQLNQQPNGLIEDSLTFLKQLNRESEHNALVPILQSLNSYELIVLAPTDHASLNLTVEGLNYATDGTPEYRLYTFVAEPQTQASLLSKFGKELLSIATSAAMKKKWISYDKAENTYKQATPGVVDELGDKLKEIAAGNFQVDEVLNTELKRRKLVSTSTYKTYGIRKGPNFALTRKSKATDLTVEMMRNNEWAETEFKEYNFLSLGAPTPSGCLHPLMKVRTQFRSILLEMGFSEMPTNQFVESSFWNFDALFQPQQHPARDSHDTFFLTSPRTAKLPVASYVSKVKAMHEHGGDGSIGYRYDWKVDEAEKTILRTHTTAVSTRMLYALAQNQPFKPSKYFSIDRVFRNETLDATHLAEFHQVEGLIADYDLSLGDLLGTIETFFKRIGISGVKFKPAYNPYTEPSMEIFGFSTQLGKWIEVGNSGMFRPEMLKPMGFDDNVRVIAWGLSLERPTMIKYGIRNIRDLFGPKVKLDLIQRNPIARFDD